MRTFILLFYGIAGFSALLSAQTPGSATRIHTFSAEEKETALSPELDIPLEKTAHFIAFTLRCNGETGAAAFEIRTAAPGLPWSNWQTLHDDPHADPAPGRRQFDMVFLPADVGRIQIRASGLTRAVETMLFFYSPPEALESDPAPIPPLADRGACPCPQPAFVNRAGWGGPPNQQPGCTPAYSDVTHLVVHHQAGAANPPYAATVLAIWQQHVNVNGWCDIGYNWLIAPDGTIFEGRAGGNNVIGAHFSGNNSNTMGVCFLGNFQNDQPTAAALASLEKLLAWKSCDSNIAPTDTALHAASGLTLPRICGHRDGGATLCPGANLYARLPGVRLDTDSLYRDPSGCDGVWPPANDACATALPLVSALSCQPLSATTGGATASGVPIPTCSGFTSGSALDVWFRFTAVETKHRVTVQPLGSGPGALDPVVALYADNCAAPQLIDCTDAPGGAGGLTALTVNNLTPGQSYRVRVFDFGTAPAADGRFDICVTHGPSVGTADAGPAAVDWRVFPNPATGWLAAQLPETFPAGSRFRLLNIAGIPVRQQILNTRETRIDLTGLPPGLYLAEWQTAEGTEMRRVVVR